ncbi:hypothetical protein TWF481_008030 [Arthrobotrys musiformis]|uniref:Uncharacterized protein n=1 Tax=Arthrobotrys musiformis TaxID=47236 RepID=A0AAV9W7V3_9PEZI
MSRVAELHKAWGGDRPPESFHQQPPVYQPIVPLSDQQLVNLTAALEISSPIILPRTEEEYMDEFVDEMRQFGLNQNAAG